MAEIGLHPACSLADHWHCTRDPGVKRSQYLHTTTCYGGIIGYFWFDFKDCANHEVTFPGVYLIQIPLIEINPTALAITTERFESPLLEEPANTAHTT